MNPNLQLLVVVQCKIHTEYHLSRFGVDKATNVPYTHKFTVNLRPLNANIIKCVEFCLHPSFEHPYSRVSKPPYEISMRAYGGFEMNIKFTIHKRVIERTLTVDLPFEDFKSKLDYLILPFGVAVNRIQDYVNNSCIPVLVDENETVICTDLRNRLLRHGTNCLSIKMYPDAYAYVSKRWSISEQVVSNDIDDIQLQQKSNNKSMSTSKSHTKSEKRDKIKKSSSSSSTLNQIKTNNYTNSRDDSYDEGNFEDLKLLKKSTMINTQHKIPQIPKKVSTIKEERIATQKVERIATPKEERIATQKVERIATPKEERKVTQKEERKVTQKDERKVTQKDERIATQKEEKVSIFHGNNSNNLKRKYSNDKLELINKKAKLTTLNNEKISPCDSGYKSLDTGNSYGSNDIKKSNDLLCTIDYDYEIDNNYFEKSSNFKLTIFNEYYPIVSKCCKIFLKDSKKLEKLTHDLLNNLTTHNFEDIENKQQQQPQKQQQQINFIQRLITCRILNNYPMSYMEQKEFRKIYKSYRTSNTNNDTAESFKGVNIILIDDEVVKRFIELLGRCHWKGDDDDDENENDVSNNDDDDDYWGLKTIKQPFEWYKNIHILYYEEFP